MTKKTSSIITLLTMSILLIPASAFATTPVEPNPNVDVQIDGAGASFPFPLIDLWRVEYGELYPTVQLNYQSIGSGGGVKNHISKTVIFAASDAPLKPAEREAAPNTLHIPEAIGAVTVAYNVPEIPESGLKLTGTIIADIFLGKITKFNDPAIQELNPEISLPDEDIVVAHRSDGSGTTFVFVSYLAEVSSEWDEKVGAGKSVEWPTGIGGKGNEGVATIVKTTPYSIGYIELAYAFQNDIPYASVENADGTNFVAPSMQSIADASAGAAPTLPEAHESWYGVSLLNAPGKNSYPIATFTYLLLYEDLNKVTNDPNTVQALMHMINWMITDGQKFNQELLYVPIAPEVQKIGIDGLKRVQFNGQSAWAETSSSMVSTQTTSSESSEGGGCLIATAAFGSEMAPQVQFLREIREGKGMATQSGTAFMTGFNQFYYSFSPAVADYERENPVFKETVKLALTPMLTSLTLLNHVSVDTEEQMLGWGISLILLNIGMYFVAPAVIIAKIKKRLRN